MQIEDQKLSSDQIKHFEDEGYLIVPNVFSPEDLEPIRASLESEIDVKVNELYRKGTIAHTHEGEEFEQRIARIYADDSSNGETVLRHLEGASGGGFQGRSIFDLITHPKLLAVVSSLVGPEIIASSAYRVRPKIQGSKRGNIPWHQDSGYFARHCDGHLILTCWVPLVDATAENGCMEIIPRSHRQGILTHHSGGNSDLLVITEDNLPVETPPRITAECPFGGVVFMTNLTAHCSTPNYSDVTRWSVDIRYQSADHPTNVGLLPDQNEKDFESNIQIACYPPEADFIVQSERKPAAVVDFEGFRERREAYQTLAIKAPRDWTPI